MEQYIGINGLNNDVKVCVIISDNSNLKCNAEEGVFYKNKLDDFVDSDYNVAIIVQKSFERGINILTKDERGVTVAAFSTLVYIKRPYAVPDNMLDMVAILNESAMDMYSMNIEQAIEECGGEYSISAFAKKIINISHKHKDKFYERSYYHLLDDKERRIVLANLLVVTHQLEGRFYRGNVPATIIFADGAFFPQEMNRERQSENYKTSIIEGFLWYFNNLKNDTSPNKNFMWFIIEKLYGFRIEALKNIEYL